MFSKCKWFTWEITNYKWKKRKDTGTWKEDEPSDRDDHHMDGIISFMAGAPATRVVEPDPVDDRPEWKKTLEEELDELTGAGVIDFMEL